MSSFDQVILSEVSFDTESSGNPYHVDQPRSHIIAPSPSHQQWTTELYQMKTHLESKIGPSRPVRPSSAGIHRNAAPRRPARPMSARIRPSSATNTAVVSRPGIRRRVTSSGVNKRVQSIYNDVGRMEKKAAARSLKRSIPSYGNTTRMIDEPEYLKEIIVKIKQELKEEQEQKMKANSRIRRLEEALTMKEKRIEELLRSQVAVQGSEADRQIAMLKKQHHLTMQKIQSKLAKQNGQIVTYENTINDLRSDIKSTHLMELEAERDEYFQEVLCLRECLRRQELQHQIRMKQKLSKTQGVDHEIAYLTSSIAHLENDKCRLEQDCQDLKHLLRDSNNSSNEIKAGSPQVHMKRPQSARPRAKAPADRASTTGKTFRPQSARLSKERSLANASKTTKEPHKDTHVSFEVPASSTGRDTERSEKLKQRKPTGLAGGGTGKVGVGKERKLNGRALERNVEKSCSSSSDLTSISEKKPALRSQVSFGKRKSSASSTATRRGSIGRRPKLSVEYISWIQSTAAMMYEETKQTVLDQFHQITLLKELDKMNRGYTAPSRKMTAAAEDREKFLQQQHEEAGIPSILKMLDPESAPSPPGTQSRPNSINSRYMSTGTLEESEEGLDDDIPDDEFEDEALNSGMDDDLDEDKYGDSDFDDEG